ncbi:hypothetical protein [Mycolicibacterium tusciae]|uniref:hypothetical protein n=1 Tax=Mycolicibacterium tusciae TaxID=75922 RepID=UPI00024A4BBF|nr:hypothetical protein [Mycolicibacterium tusciae]
MKVRGPLITLAAVAAVGVGILTVNIAQEESVVPGTPVAAPTPLTTTAATPPAPAFPAKADYVGKVPTANGTITLDIAVEGDRAVAYACDGTSIESWMRGSAVNGAVSLVSKDGTGRLEGRLDGAAVVGTLWIGEKKWDFRAETAQPPAGLYVYEQGGVRSSWIVDSSGKATGVLRQDDGSTAPAPGLENDGSAVIGGRTVTAARVRGASDV